MNCARYMAYLNVYKGRGNGTTSGMRNFRGANAKFGTSFYQLDICKILFLDRSKGGNKQRK